MNEKLRGWTFGFVGALVITSGIIGIAYGTEKINESNPSEAEGEIQGGYYFEEIGVNAYFYRDEEGCEFILNETTKDIQYLNDSCDLFKYESANRP